MSHARKIRRLRPKFSKHWIATYVQPSIILELASCPCNNVRKINIYEKSLSLLVGEGGHRAGLRPPFLRTPTLCVGYAKSATDEGCVSAERNASPAFASLRHKGRGNFSDYRFSYFISIRCPTRKCEIYTRLHIGGITLILQILAAASGFW
jgi:hypothetical protein